MASACGGEVHEFTVLARRHAGVVQRGGDLDLDDLELVVGHEQVLARRAHLLARVAPGTRRWNDGPGRLGDLCRARTARQRYRGRG